MVWAVIKFTNENAVEVVPAVWFVRSSQECFWPPTSTKKSKIIDFIKMRQDPGVDWKAFPAVLLGEYDDFNTAQRKASKAQTTDELTSAAENAVKGRGYRKSQRNKRYDSDSYSENDESSDDNKYPTLRKEITGIATTEATTASVSRPSMRSSEPLLTTSGLFRSHQTVEDSSNIRRNEILCTSGSSRAEQTPSMSSVDSTQSLSDIGRPKAPNGDFQRIVLSELSLLNLKLNTALEKIDALTRIRRTETEFPLASLEQVPQILYMLPIQNNADLKQLEDWLAERNNQKIMIKELSRIGGTSVNQTTRKIMYRTLSNQIGMEYSWEGLKKKKPFKSLNLSVVILESIRICCGNATETEIISIIKLWLVRSKDRFENSRKITREENILENVHEDPGEDIN